METITSKQVDGISVADQEGIYLYAIIAHTGPISFGNIGIGNNSQVYGINYKDVCAVVSHSPTMRYQAKRVHMMAHQLVLEEVMKQFDILPIRFSTISETYDESKIVDILKREYEQFSGLLAEVAEKKELGLKVLIQEKPIFDFILNKYESISSAKEEVSKLPEDQAHFRVMHVGEMVAKAMKDECEEFKADILETLSPIADDVKVNDSYGESMVLNAAFLVSESKVAEFDKAVNVLNERFGKLLLFKYAGPLPPYNFVNAVIHLE